MNKASSHDALFQDVHTQGTSSLTDVEIRQLADTYIKNALRHHAEWKLSLPRPLEQEELEMRQRACSKAASHMANNANRADLKTIKKITDAVLDEAGQEQDKTSLQYKKQP